MIQLSWVGQWLALFLFYPYPEKPANIFDALLVSTRNDVWETSARIPYWWHVTRCQIILGSASDWSCQMGNLHKLLNQKHSQIWEMTHCQIGISVLVSRSHFPGKPVVVFRKVGCLLGLSYPPPLWTYFLCPLYLLFLDPLPYLSRAAFSIWCTFFLMVCNRLQVHDVPPRCSLLSN